MDVEQNTFKEPKQTSFVAFILVELAGFRAEDIGIELPKDILVFLVEALRCVFKGECTRRVAAHISLIGFKGSFFVVITF